MNISQRGIDLIKHFEAFYPTAYLCSAGVPTIGWGTVKYPNGKTVKLGEKCTAKQAERWLAYELHLKQADILRVTEGVTMMQPQFDALVSFSYNLGSEALGGSNLMKLFRKNPYDGRIVGDEDLSYLNFGRNGEFIRWNRADNTISKGLIRRRKAEAWLYATGENRFFEEMINDVKTAAGAYVSAQKK